MQTRDLREILRYRASLVRNRTQLKNKIQSILSKNGVSSPFSDLFGKGGIQFLKSVQLRPCFRQPIDGYLSSIEQLNVLIEQITNEIDAKAKLSEQAKLLMTIPGIGPYSAMLIFIEIGDIKRFPDAKNLVSYAGLAPGVHSSGGKTRYGHITKQGSRWLRWILIEASENARHTRRFGQLYNRVIKKHSKKTAKVAVARQILCVIYQILTKGESFKDLGSRGYPMCINLRILCNS